MSINIPSLIFIFIIGCIIGCVSRPAIDSSYSLKSSDTLQGMYRLDNYPPQQLEDLKPINLDSPILYAPAPEFDVRTVEIAEEDTIVSFALGKNLSAALADGFRVQVYSGRDPIQAKQVENLFRERGWTTYLIYEAPQYRVRIGDYNTRLEALAMCDSLRRSGCPQAWVVRSMINQP
ncbi:MAG: SPOR domain-containing protein [Calditrichaeota bacterium]|nr:SPOR domain-containing protein [Calditrichota bacterium]